jgi:chaperonin GroES
VLRPLYDQVVILPAQAKTVRGEQDGFEAHKSEGGIFFVKDEDKGPANEGIVLAVGPGKQLDNGLTAPLPIEPGDHVLFSRFGGDERRIDGRLLIVISIGQVRAIIDNVPVGSVIDSILDRDGVSSDQPLDTPDIADRTHKMLKSLAANSVEELPVA